MDDKLIPKQAYRTVRHAAAQGMEELGWPAGPGPFRLDRGNVGVRCACGWTVIGASMAALEQGMADHQHVDYCPAFAEMQRQMDTEQFNEVETKL